MTTENAGINFIRKYRRRGDDHGIQGLFNKQSRSVRVNRQRRVRAYLVGPTVIVRDDEDAKALFSKGDFGTFVGQRMNFVNQNCFQHNNQILETDDHLSSHSNITTCEGTSKALNDTIFPIHGNQAITTINVDETSTHKIEFNKVSTNSTVLDELESNTLKTDLQLQRPHTNQNDSKTTEEQHVDSRNLWLEKTRSSCIKLYLSPYEALYLALPHRDRTNAISGIYNRLRIDIFDEISGERMILKDLYTKFYVDNGRELFAKRFAAYRHFRWLGWVVRDGISYGVDFLLYKDGIDEFHSSVGVRVLDGTTSFSPSFLNIAALQRGLCNNKKSLLLAIVTKTTGNDDSKQTPTLSIDGIDELKITTQTIENWRPDTGGEN